MNNTTHKKDILPLTADLTTVELAEALATLRFQGESQRLVSLDRGVRDYLLSAVSAQRGKKEPRLGRH